MIALAAALLVLVASPAHAYIGPGAGFAFAGAPFVLLTTLVLVVFTLLTWPFTLVYRAIRVGNPFKHAHAPGASSCSASTAWTRASRPS